MKAIDGKLARVLPPVLLIALLIAVWWIVVARSDSPIFPTPGQVASGAWALAQDGTLWAHIEASLFRVEIGFGLAFLVAVPLGLWMGWVSGAYYTLNPLFQMLRPISPIAWIPVAILWFGVGDFSPIFLIFISSVFPMMVQTTVGVRTIDRRYLRAAANFGVSRRVLFTRVVIPAVLPEIIVGMRIGLGVAWLVAIETRFNGGFDEAVRWLWLPWLVAVVTYVRRYWRWLRSNSRYRKPWQILALSLMTWLMLLPMVPSIMLMVNPLKEQPWQYAVPFLAQNQMLLKVIRAESIPMQVWGIYLAAGFGVAAVLWFAAVRRYHQERLAISG